MMLCDYEYISLIPQDEPSSYRNVTSQPHKVYRHSISLPNGDLSDIQESCSSNSGEDSRRPSGLCADVTDDIEKEAFEDIELVNQSTSAQSVKSYRRNAVIQEPLTINKGITSTGEAYLFHGTKLRNIISIIENGFIIDPKSEGLFGTGLYLAESSQRRISTPMRSTIDALLSCPCLSCGLVWVRWLYMIRSV